MFLCHNSADKPEVREIGSLLEAEGLLPWLDEWELRPGLPWQRALEDAIGSIQSAAVFIGSSGIGPWQDQELAAFIRQFVKRGLPVIPVLLRSASSKPKLPIFLEAMTWVDFREHGASALARLVWGITGNRPRIVT